ncbi:MAG: radical SAM family heme chaperone HemW [Lachnospiraceae bacterium]|nr:radical SAM family heme chaperone HemW [Lachnospiraceae bacterium]
MKELSIYIHIPFCIRKCLYCDFLSFPAEIGNYVNLLCREISSSAPEYQQYQVVSVFLGGGTPSVLPAMDISLIMETIRDNYRISQDIEVTMEMNPGTVDEDKLRQYITAGMNRISIGLQSADDEELLRIGRIHDYQTFLRTYELARRVGFHNINIDIMSALPGQSVVSYERTLRAVTSLEPEHISAYSLILEEGTPLYERQYEYSFPTEEEDREMYSLTKDFLSSCGYHRYEISNYAREGYECCHNKVYWQRGDYVGFGLGASSMVRNVRWKNPEDLTLYEAYVYRQEDMCVPDRQILTEKEQMEEYMFLGLRMMCGVNRQGFARTFGRQIEEAYGEIPDRLCRQGLLAQDKNNMMLTELGIDVSNYVFAQFLFD